MAGVNFQIAEQVRQTLLGGIAKIKSNPSLYIPQIIENTGVNEVSELQAAFPNTDLDVIHGYPTAEAPLPVFTVILNTDDESGRFWGDVLFRGVDPSTGNEVVQRGEQRQEIFQVGVYAESPSQVEQFRAVAQWILFDQKSSLWARDLTDIHITVAPIEYVEGMAPQVAFVRKISIQLLVDVVTETVSVTNFRKVVNVAVNRS